LNNGLKFNEVTAITLLSSMEVEAEHERFAVSDWLGNGAGFLLLAIYLFMLKEYHMLFTVYAE
jgi:hypothetical protein